MPRFPRVLHSAPSFAITILALTVSLAAQVPSDFHPRLAVLNSQGTINTLSYERVVLALWYASEELSVPVEQLPRIVVVRGCPDSAKVMDFVVVRRLVAADGFATVITTEVPDTKERVYEAWIVGNNTEYWLAKAMITILNMHLGLKVDIEEHSLRIFRRMSATVSRGVLASEKPAPWPKRTP